MTAIKGPAPKPCESCPYRQDVPSGVWSREEYEKLRGYDAETFAQPMNLFQCHQTSFESEQSRLCAGWVGVHGQDLMALRIGVARGTVDPVVMEYTTDVPLFASGSEAAAHGMREIDDPGPAARAMVVKIMGNRPEVTLR